MAVINTNWQKVKEVYVGNDGYHDIYWRMYARIVSQNSTTTNVGLLGRLYISGTAGSFSAGATTTAGGSIGSYSAWGVNVAGTYTPGEWDLWYGASDVATSAGSVVGTVRFYSSPWGWTGDNLVLTETLVFATPPTGLSVSLNEVLIRGAKLDVSVTGWGSGTSGYVEGAIMGQSTYGGKYRIKSTPNLSGTVQVDNNAGGTSTGLTIVPNTQYWYGGYATNGLVTTGGTVVGTLVTLPDLPARSVRSIANGVATIDYTLLQDGGYYPKTLEYSTDGGDTWNVVTTVASGNATSGSFEVTDVDEGTELLIRVTTTSGSTYGEPLSFSADGWPFYGSVSGRSRKTSKLYGPWNILESVSATVPTSTGLVTAFNPALFIQKYNDFFVTEAESVIERRQSFKLRTIRVVKSASGTPSMTLLGPSNMSAEDAWLMNLASAGPLSEWGITIDETATGTAVVDNVPVSSAYTQVTKEVDKLYGSVAGNTTLLFKG